MRDWNSDLTSAVHEIEIEVRPYLNLNSGVMMPKCMCTFNNYITFQKK